MKNKIIVSVMFILVIICVVLTFKVISDDIACKTELEQLPARDASTGKFIPRK